MVERRYNGQALRPDLPQEAGAGLRWVITEAPLGLVCVDPSARPSELSLPSFSSSHREATLSHFILGENMRSKVEHADAGTIPKVYIYYCNAGMCAYSLKQLIFLTQAYEQPTVTFSVIGSNSDIQHFTT